MPVRLPRLDPLRHADEAGFERWLRQVMALFGVHGWHMRESQGNLVGVTKSDAFGIPDWYIWRESDDSGRGGWHMWRELKTNSGTLSGWQKVMHASMKRAGEDVDVWRPRDETRILAELRRG